MQLWFWNVGGRGRLEEWEGNIKIDFKQVGLEVWIRLVILRLSWRPVRMIKSHGVCQEALWIVTVA
jgi:hypothetical protein